MEYCWIRSRMWQQKSSALAAAKLHLLTSFLHSGHSCLHFFDPWRCEEPLESRQETYGNIITISRPCCLCVCMSWGKGLYLHSLDRINVQKVVQNLQGLDMLWLNDPPPESCKRHVNTNVVVLQAPGKCNTDQSHLVRTNFCIWRVVFHGLRFLMIFIVSRQMPSVSWFSCSCSIIAARPQTWRIWPRCKAGSPRQCSESAEELQLKNWRSAWWVSPGFTRFSIIVLRATSCNI